MESLMQSFDLLVDVAVLMIAAYLIWDVVQAYKAAAGDAWQRCVAASKDAAKSMWTGFTVMVTAAAGALASLADFVNAPSVASAVQTYAQPKIVAAVMIGSAIIIEWAKRAKSQ
jgi:hypothetical protein